MPRVVADEIIAAPAVSGNRQASGRPGGRWNGVAASSYQRPHQKMAEYAAQLFGPAAHSAMEAITNPDTKVDRGLRRRAMDMFFPHDRPITLDVPNPLDPDSLDAAMDAIHEACFSGKISPDEALTCQALVRNRYAAMVRAKSGRSR